MADIKIIMEGVDNASNVIKGIGGAIGKLGAIAAGIGAAGIGAIGAGLAIAVHEAMDAQQNMADLTATLQATGRTGLTESILETAQSLKDLAGGSDDAVIGVENMLVGFKEIGDKTLPKATQATLDLAAKMKISTEAAADMLGPILATGDRLMGLKKANIVFTDSEKDKIKALFDAGDAAAAQQIILDKLSSTIGGTAAASAKTLGSQFTILKNHILDIAEAFGTKLMPIVQEAFSRIAPLIETFADTISKNLGAAMFVLGPRFEELGKAITNLWSVLSNLLGLDFSGFNLQAILTQTIGVLADIIEAATTFTNWLSVEIPVAVQMANSAWLSFIEAIQPVVLFFQPIIDGIVNLAAAISSHSAEMVSGLSGLTQFVMQYLGPGFQQIIDNIIGYITQLRDNTTQSLNAMATFWAEWGDEIMTVLGVLIGVIAVTLVETIVLASGVITATLQLLSGNWSGAWHTMSATLSTFFNVALGLVGTNLAEFTAVWQNNWEMLKTIVSTLTMQITSGIQDWLINLINTLKSFLPMVLQFGKDFANNIIQGVLLMAGQIAQVAYDVVSGAVKAAASALGGAASAAAGAMGKPGGFQSGGFTGVGASNEVAGVVHRNEWVVPEGGALVLRSNGDSGGLTNYGTINITMAGGETDLRALIRNLRMATI